MTLYCQSHVTSCRTSTSSEPRRVFQTGEGSIPFLLLLQCLSQDLDIFQCPVRYLETFYSIHRVLLLLVYTKISNC